MKKTTVGVSYVQSLLWIALFFAVAIGAMNVVQLVILDFIHGNPHRSQSNALFMMTVFTPLFGVIVAIGALLVFALPQIFQALLVGILKRAFGDRARFAVLLALPLTAVLTWYCFDYLTPADFNLGINEGPDWTPYRHGISMARYLTSLGFQAPVTLFGFLYFDAGLKGRARKPVIIAALAIAFVLGAISGFEAAQRQIQLL
jgi:hypothetical protein